LAKIALDCNKETRSRTEAGSLAARCIAQGDGWCVSDIVCTSGPRDLPFEERHTNTSIAIVAAGTFQYRSDAGRELMTPGSLLLGNAGQCFECSHEHATGDRCFSFWYAPEFFERLAVEAGGRVRGPVFRALRLPPLRALSAVIARSCAAVFAKEDVSWEELSIELAARSIQLAQGVSPGSGAEPSSIARVTRSIRMIEHRIGKIHSLAHLAQEARLSPFHFLRTFRVITGVTPHQYLRRLRLRESAIQINTEKKKKIIDVAIDCGFEDISTFNRAFRAEFGATPRAFRSAA
jgi:AraC-like DNA-binding protein